MNHAADRGRLAGGHRPGSHKGSHLPMRPHTSAPKVEAAIAKRVNKVFKQNDIGMPLPGQEQSMKTAVFEKAWPPRKVFGDRIEKCTTMP